MKHVTVMFLSESSTMPSRRGCSSNLRFLIELYSILLLVLVFAAITMLWCLAARNYPETGLTIGTNVSNATSNGNYAVSTSPPLKYLPSQIAHMARMICRSVSKKISCINSDEVGITLCECDPFVGYVSICFIRRKQTEPTEAIRPSPAMDGWSEELRNLGNLMDDVPGDVEAFVASSRHFSTPPYDSPRQLNASDELCKNLSAKFNSKGNETIVVVSCNCIPEAQQVIMCIKRSRPRESLNSACFNVPTTITKANRLTNVCGTNPPASTIDEMVKRVKHIWQLVNIDNSARNSTSRGEKLSGNQPGKPRYNGGASRHRRNADNDSAWDDPLARMLADTMESMVVEQAQKQQLTEQTTSAKTEPVTKAATTTTSPSSGTPIEPSSSFLHQELYKVNKAMWISAIVILTISLIYTVVIIAVWLLKDRPIISEPVNWRSMSVQSMRRSLLPRDSTWN